MGPQYTLVRIYLFVCQHYRGRLAATTQRQSNNDRPDFTDEEVLTIYRPKPFQKARDRQRRSRVRRGSLFRLVSGPAVLSELQSAPKPAKRSIFPTYRQGASGNRGEGSKKNDPPHCGLDANYDRKGTNYDRKGTNYDRKGTNYDRKGTKGLPGEGRLRTDCRHRILFLEGHLLPWDKAARCRRAKKRHAPSSETDWTHFCQRK